MKNEELALSVKRRFLKSDRRTKVSAFAFLVDLLPDDVLREINRYMERIV